ncbi:MAG: thiamine phosphate synthase, partial [Lawsonibacter sp.]|nr:thiamine phosphate synthase [Lawsonibacter sp.]
MKSVNEHLLLYAVTDRAWLGGAPLAWQVEASLKGGATMIQLREKRLNSDAFRAEALEVKELCRRYGVPFLINDNVELALEIGADGVHVGQEDMEPGRVPP